MNGLKQLRTRIKIVASTMKMTSAMKIISVSKLRKAHLNLVKAYAYAGEIDRMIRRLVRAVSVLNKINDDKISMPLLLKGREKEKTFLIVAILSNEGLCGQFNQALINQVERLIAYLKSQDKQVMLLCFGRKGGELLQYKHPELNVHIMQEKDNNSTLDNAQKLSHAVIVSFFRDLFDVCLLVYSQFQSITEQKSIVSQLIPVDSFNPENRWKQWMDLNTVSIVETKKDPNKKKLTRKATLLLQAVGGKILQSPLQNIEMDNLEKESTRPVEAYDYEPNLQKMLEDILPTYVGSCIYKILLESKASESTSRLMAMDNASRNAEEMMQMLQKKYHRKRQEIVTQNLIEIISGAQGGA